MYNLAVNNNCKAGMYSPRCGSFGAFAQAFGSDAHLVDHNYARCNSRGVVFIKSSSGAFVECVDSHHQGQGKSQKRFAADVNRGQALRDFVDYQRNKGSKKRLASAHAHRGLDDDFSRRPLTTAPALTSEARVAEYLRQQSAFEKHQRQQKKVVEKLSPLGRFADFSDNNNYCSSISSSYTRSRTISCSSSSAGSCEFTAEDFKLDACAVKRSSSRPDNKFPSRRQSSSSKKERPVILYPFNASLEDDLSRLFTNYQKSFEYTPNRDGDETWMEFQSNGKDFEYIADENKNYHLPIARRMAKKSKKRPVQKECVFCKNNKESPLVYKSHCTKDEYGIVRCPVLRRYICPTCQASGDKAHTLKYCPSKKIVDPNNVIIKNY